MADVTPTASPFPVSGRIFFSCAPADETEVMRLAAALASHGVSIIPVRPSSQRGTAAWTDRVQREISACDLFLPVISSHTETDAEGKFREEWQRAAERATSTSEALPFLVPLVLDNIPAAGARVPEIFRQLQWIPLPAAHEEAALTARLQEMLRQHDSFRLRRDRQVTPPLWVQETETPAPAPVAAARGFGPKLWLTAGVVLAVGLGAVGFFVFHRGNNEGAATKPTDASARSATTAAVRVPTPARAPRLDAMRIQLAAFENLTGDRELDNVSQLVTAELTRAFTRASGFQVLPGKSSDTEETALQTGSAILVTGNYTRVEKTVQLRAQITLVASGVSYGVLGPVALESTVSGPTLTEIVERLTTGVCEASDIARDPPAFPAKMAYARKWARWPLAQQARALTAIPLADTARRISEAEAILRVDSGLSDVRLFLAGALRDAGRIDEADALFGQLYGQRFALSEAELNEALYERSLLLGNIETALPAARELSALRPFRPIIDNVISCLFALNRPASALKEFTVWLDGARPGLTAAEITRREIEAITLEVLVRIRQGETAKAQVSLAALKTRLGPAGSLTALQLESLVIARAGSRTDFDRLLDRVSDLPAVSRLEAVRTAYHLHCQFLHVGRSEDAAHFLERAQRLWSGLPAAVSASADVSTVLLQADLSLAQHRPLDALAALDRAPSQVVASNPLDFIGRRALALQDLGRTSDFAVVLAKLESADLRNTHGLPLYWRARLAARAGLQKSAAELLRLAKLQGLWLDDLHRIASSYGRSEPEFAALHGIPAYEDLLRPKN